MYSSYWSNLMLIMEYASQILSSSYCISFDNESNCYYINSFENNLVIPTTTEAPRYHFRYMIH
ncbi:hypothetical protein KSF78_0002022 [Schistosoma japonicum]|nr:hypothetical protein KSF78_0002022 [Schistosoma japonicum]